MTTPMRILITGISGFVGGYLAQRCRLSYPNATIYGMYRSTAHGKEILAYIQPVIGDMLLLESIQRVIEQIQPDLIFHLAAQSSVVSSWSDPVGTLQVNAQGAIHLFEALRLAELSPRVVVIGSSEQYGLVPPELNPITEVHPFLPVNPYAVAKATQDLYAYQYFLAYRLPTLRVRSFNHFGPRQAPIFVVASLARQIALIEAGQAKPSLLVGNLQAQRDFLPVEDVVGAYIAVADRGQPGEAYNIGSGSARSIGDILQTLLQYTTVPIHIQEDPARLRPTDQHITMADTTRLRAHTGWKPELDINLALKQTLDYWRAMVS